MSAVSVPMPPVELRRMVGPTDEEDFDNPTGAGVYDGFGLPRSAYRSVFDFGCGCGRTARQLLQQREPPARYVGVDPNRQLIEWCRQHLSPIARAFRFDHHDVYSPGYAPQNSLQLSEAFPVSDGSVTLLIAHSVFTHVAQTQTEYYLGEVARVLAPDGVALTTWLLFDNTSFPFLKEGPYCLYTNPFDFAEAVIYDRNWLREMLSTVGLIVRSHTRPAMPGHQWTLLLEKRKSGAEEKFPIGNDGADWVCGATSLPRAAVAVSEDIVQKVKGGRETGWTALQALAVRPPQPTLDGPLAELAAMRGSWTWRLGRLATALPRIVRSVLGA